MLVESSGALVSATAILKEDTEELRRQAIYAQDNWRMAMPAMDNVQAAVYVA
jgi:hypothetical protein